MYTPRLFRETLIFPFFFQLAPTSIPVLIRDLRTDLGADGMEGG